jgi:hypothetical protein
LERLEDRVNTINAVANKLTRQRDAAFVDAANYEGQRDAALEALREIVELNPSRYDLIDEIVAIAGRVLDAQEKPNE